MFLCSLFVFISHVYAASEESEDAETSSLWGCFDSAYLQVGVGMHWSGGDDYEGAPVLGGLEVAHDDRHLFGISLFNNSFGQFSQYYYYGYKWPLKFIAQSAYFRLTGGLIYGYVGEYEDKLALNYGGWAPVIIPSLGWRHERLGFDVVVLGDAGLMFLVGYEIWRR